MPLPRQADAPGRYIPAGVRAIIVEAHQGLCFYCGLPGSSIDHIVPWSSGGDHHPMNLVLACVSCNSIAGDRVFPSITDKIAFVAERRDRIIAAGLDPQELGARSAHERLPEPFPPAGVYQVGDRVGNRTLIAQVRDENGDIDEMWGSP